MSQLVFDALPTPTVPVVGSTLRFPVRRVYCVGRNYADHAKEMGVDPRLEPPFFFCKPADSVVSNLEGPVDVPYPPMTQNFHYEVELVLAIGKSGAHIPVELAADHIWGHAVGVDMTRRDLQLQMRNGGKPWEIGKTFDRCAPIGPIHRKEQEIADAAITLAVNGQVRQASNVAKMIWSAREIVATLSQYFTLEPGDLIFTGTPEGVGAVRAGDTLTATIDGLTPLEISVTPCVHVVDTYS